MAHVVNLVVQAILAELNEADDPEQEDYYIPNKHIPFHYDLDNDKEVRQMEDEQDEEGGEDSDNDDASGLARSSTRGPETHQTRQTNGGGIYVKIRPVHHANWLVGC